MLAPAHLARLLAAGCLALGLWTLADAGALRDLRAAERAGARGDYAGAAAQAARIDRGAAGVRAPLVEAYALRAAGRTTAAVAAFRRALAADPARASIHRDLGALLLETGDRRGARRSLRRALALDPRMQLPPGVTVLRDRQAGVSR